MTIPEYGLMAASSLFAIINPIAAVPAFFAMTPHANAQERTHTARRACMTCAGVLILFCTVGQMLFKVFGISLPSFQIAGGVILFMVSMDSIRAKRSPVQETAEEMEAGASKEDVSITPLAIPMLSGPGAITTVIILASRAEDLLQRVLLYAVILAVSGLCYLIFYAAVSGARRTSPILMNVTTRLMGLILVATSVEFILSALRTLQVLPKVLVR